MSLNKTSLPKASILKRLLAILYDVLIVFFLTFIITLIVQQFIVQLELIPLEQIQISKAGETVNIIPSDSFVTPVLKSLWFFISFYYFGYFWTKRGQTPGMKVWKIIAVNDDGGDNSDTSKSTMTWLQAAKRYLFSLFGAGLMWIVFDKDRLALQDRASGTHLQNHT